MVTIRKILLKCGIPLGYCLIGMGAKLIVIDFLGELKPSQSQHLIAKKGF